LNQDPEAMSAGPEMDATAILARVADGDQSAVELLLPLVYEELRRLAQSYFRFERADHTLEPTALVHEAFLRLADQTRVNWKGRAHFCAVAATAMRRILADHARQHRAQKRGADRQRVPLTGIATPSGQSPADIVSLDEALDDLARLDPRQYQIVELRFFGGLTVEEVSTILDVSVSTAEADWRMARAWLKTRLRETDDS
jgi:RNA polymerase sigma factor (TIGR02999 family)